MPLKGKDSGISQRQHATNIVPPDPQHQNLPHPQTKNKKKQKKKERKGGGVIPSVVYAILPLPLLMEAKQKLQEER